PADAFRPVPRHQANHDGAHHRHENHERTKVMSSRGDLRSTETLEKEKIRKEADELQQARRHVGCGHADDDGEPGYGKNSCGGGEIAEVIERAVPDVRYMARGCRWHSN